MRYEKCSGGGKIGSTVSLKAFSSIEGISLASKGDDSSKQGFVFTSIRYTLKSRSIMKSRPKHCNKKKRQQAVTCFEVPNIDDDMKEILVMKDESNR